MSPAPTAFQLQAIEALRAILQDYKHQPNPAPPPGVPPPSPKEYRHHPHPALPPGVPPPNPPPSPGVQLPPDPGPPLVPPTQGDDVWTPVLRGRRHVTWDHAPIASRTRARLATPNRFALLSSTDTPIAPSGSTDNIALPVLDQATGRMLEHRQLRSHPNYKAIWDQSYANELGWLCQGIGTDNTSPTGKRIDGTDTFRPIAYMDIPSDRRQDVTYSRVVCEVRPTKNDPNRTRITIGGNRICYPGDTGTRTGSLELVKLQLNNVLSTPHARFATFDISNFYLGTPLDRPEYVRIKFGDIPTEFVNEYDLTSFAHNDWVYFEINKGVYGLKQAGRLANDLLSDRLQAFGYFQSDTTPGLWRHKWRPISFVLIVDDFGIQFVEQRHANHLLHALQQYYTVTTDWTGQKFAGIDLAWDYKQRTCRLSMRDYITLSLIHI